MTDKDNDSTDGSDILDQIAEEIGTITEEQESDDDDSKPAREGDGEPEDMDKRNMNDYHGSW